MTYKPTYEDFLAPYACFSSRSRGRLHDEGAPTDRSEFQRDRDRIIHSTAFRRLEYKTQVFVYHEGDHYRTRLTHSLEVAQLAKTMARELRLDEDLAEAIALAHDLGHTPFGHAGEDALNEAMQPYGGFDHNAQSIAILTGLENKYAAFDGLNLTWECLEGIAKHNGPVDKPSRALKEYNDKHDLELNTHASLEAQIAAICDDIAYNNHDIEDGIRAFLFSVDDLRDLPLVGEIIHDLRKQYPDIDEGRLVYETKRRMINRMIADLLEQIQANIAEHQLESVDDVRALGKQVAHMSPEMETTYKTIKEFLWQHMYRHYKVNRMTSKAKRVTSELFGQFMDEPNTLPTSWAEHAELAKDEHARAIIIANFIAGMTDRFAFEEHRRIFDTSYKLIRE